MPVDGRVPDPARESDATRAKYLREALDYMGLAPGTKLTDIAVDRVFIGSCTNSRIEDLRAAAAVLSGRVSKVPGLVSPGSSSVKRQAEEEGLDKIFRDAGLEWADSGCSMCVGINGDLVPSGERCASTTNRNFRGRQGPGARTHLMSPAMVAAAAVSGHLADVRPLLAGRKALEAPMDKFVRLTATACPLSLPNLNTDQILPARYLKWPRSKGLGTVLFDDVRLDAKGQPREDFAFNKDAYRGAKVLLAGRNFGGGSSREAAVYALYDHGFRCVVAPSFGDIFSQNAVKNGLLTAVAAEADIEKLAALVREKPSQPVTVDLERQTVSGNGISFAFMIDPISRNQLLNGWDDVDLTESYREQIAAFKAKDRTIRPWAVPLAKQ